IDLDFVRLQLGGKSSGGNKTFFYNNLRFPLREESNDFLPRLWATRRVGWLMEQVRTNGEQRELHDEIVDLGTRYGIVTPYTSYLAVESQPADVTRAGGSFSGGQVNTQNQSLSTNGARHGAMAPPPASTMSATTGAAAVAQRAATGAILRAGRARSGRAGRQSLPRQLHKQISS